MSLVRRNLAANFLGNGWSALVNIVAVPFYLHFLGIEAYGLVGTYTSLRSLATVFDGGMGGTLLRELAHMQAVAAPAADRRDLVRTLELPYWLTALTIGVVMVAMAPWLASDWFRTEQIAPETLREVLVVMGIALAVQSPGSLYAMGVRGLQHQVIEQSVTATIVGVRAAGSLLVLWLVSPTLYAFFIWQLIVEVLRITALASALWWCLPRDTRYPRFRPQLLKARWRYTAGLAIGSVVGIALAQMDRVVLSRILSLPMLGYYNIAALIAANLARLVGPVSSAIAPHVTQLTARGDSASLARTYHRASQLLAVAVLPASLVLAAFPSELLVLWLRDVATATLTAPVLSLLALAAALQVLVRLAFTVQFASGSTRLAVMVNSAKLLLGVPMLAITASAWGVIGAGAAILGLAILHLALVVVLMHRRLLRGELRAWLFGDIAPPAITSLLVVAALRALPAPTAILPLGAFMAFTLVAASGSAALAAPATRAWLQQHVWRRPI